MSPLPILLSLFLSEKQKPVPWLPTILLFLLKLFLHQQVIWHHKEQIKRWKNLECTPHVVGLGGYDLRLDFSLVPQTRGYGSKLYHLWFGSLCSHCKEMEHPGCTTGAELLGHFNPKGIQSAWTQTTLQQNQGTGWGPCGDSLTVKTTSLLSSKTLR